MCDEPNCTHAVDQAVGEHTEEVLCTCDREGLNEYEHYEDCPWLDAYPVPHVSALEIPAKSIRPEVLAAHNTRTFTSFVYRKCR